MNCSDSQATLRSVISMKDFQSLCVPRDCITLIALCKSSRLFQQFGILSPSTQQHNVRNILSRLLQLLPHCYRRCIFVETVSNITEFFRGLIVYICNDSKILLHTGSILVQFIKDKNLTKITVTYYVCILQNLESFHKLLIYFLNLVFFPKKEEIFV